MYNISSTTSEGSARVTLVSMRWLIIAWLCVLEASPPSSSTCEQSAFRYHTSRWKNTQVDSKSNLYLLAPESLSSKNNRQYKKSPVAELSRLMPEGRNRCRLRRTRHCCVSEMPVKKCFVLQSSLLIRSSKRRERYLQKFAVWSSTH